MHITSARYSLDILTNEPSTIIATINGETMYVPISQGNTEYDEIMRQVEAGELTIADAE